MKRITTWEVEAVTEGWDTYTTEKNEINTDWRERTVDGVLALHMPGLSLIPGIWSSKHFSSDP